jgi:hypothetical protein
MLSLFVGWRRSWNLTSNEMCIFYWSVSNDLKKRLDMFSIFGIHSGNSGSPDDSFCYWRNVSVLWYDSEGSLLLSSPVFIVDYISHPVTLDSTVRCLLTRNVEMTTFLKYISEKMRLSGLICGHGWRLRRRCLCGCGQWPSSGSSLKIHPAVGSCQPVFGWRRNAIILGVSRIRSYVKIYSMAELSLMCQYLKCISAESYGVSSAVQLWRRKYMAEMQ